MKRAIFMFPEFPLFTRESLAHSGRGNPNVCRGKSVFPSMVDVQEKKSAAESQV